MKILTLAIAVIGLATLSACTETGSAKATSDFSMQVEEVLKTDSIRVIKLQVQSSSGKKVYIEGEGSVMVALMDGKADLVFLADASNYAPESTTSKGVFTYMVHASTKGKEGQFAAGGPSRFPLQTPARLEDLFSFSAKPGKYPIGQPVTVAKVQNNEITIKVE